MAETETIIIGAGPAGLACAALLKQRARQSLILEKTDNVGASWRGHYDRLHLHTHKKHSGLPGLAMSHGFEKYPARKDVVRYLETYCRHHDLKPQFNTEVTSLRRHDLWHVETTDEVFPAKNVIFATGLASQPYLPQLAGIESFEGALLHSSDYKNPEPFTGQTVLVVGFGNSAGEIALDLADAGVATSLSVRGPVNVVPRDLFGIPILSFAIAQQRMPYELSDRLNAPIMRFVLGDLEKLGLQRPKKGPRAQIIEDGQIPLLDIGTIDRIRKGAIKVHGGIDRLVEGQVIFENGESAAFDSIILGTGYRANLSSYFPDHKHVLTEAGSPKVSGAASGEDGLYFCSYKPALTGQLREIGIEAERIADLIASS